MREVVDTRARDALAVNAADLLAYLVRRVDRREDAADLFGEVSLTAWRRRRGLPTDPLAARKWLFVVARNTLANHARSNRRRTALARQLAVELAREEELRRAEPGDLQSRVAEAIAQLDFASAELVRLVHWDGFTIAEAAEVMGLNASTARGRYAAARSKLAELLT